MGTRVVGLGVGSLAKPPTKIPRAYRAITRPCEPALVRPTGALERMAHGLTGLRKRPAATPQQGPSEPVALGRELVEWIQNDLPRLKPKMRHVAEQVLRQRATLHQQRIQNLAQQTRSAPATIVRLAKRYGFAGFSDLKVAFLGDTSAADGVIEHHSSDNYAPPDTCKLFGPALVQRICQDLPRLSPKMRNMAEHLLRHSSTLHQLRIKQLALQADTIPATIVRLAKRYGFIGFHDLKLAFLPNAQAPSAGPHSSPEATAARAVLDLLASRMQSLRALVEHASFQQVLQALHSAQQIAVYPAQASDRAVASYLASGLAALGLRAALAETVPVAQALVLEVRLGSQQAAAPHRAGSGWITLQSASAPLDPQVHDGHLRLTLPGEATPASDHCAFTLADALCAGLQAKIVESKNRL